MSTQTAVSDQAERLPVIGLTMGDPEGVGPELLVKGLRELSGRARWQIYGSPALFDDLDVPVISTDGARVPEREAIELAVADLGSGAIDGLMTAPVDKRAFGGEFPGHTELLQHRLGADEVAMLLAGSRLSVVPMTTHLPLRAVADALTEDLVVRQGRLVGEFLRERMGLPEPVMVVAGLNPHCGDHGLFGDEERRVLEPAIERLRGEGWNVQGPRSPDTVFHQAAQGGADVVLCGYHDQALIPFKMLHFSDGVNVTIGLPRPRTSPDHGPAKDLVGTGRADPTSTIRAMEMALQLA